MEKNISFLSPRIAPRTSSLNVLCITHCSNQSFCLLLLIYLCLSTYLFSQFCFVPRQYNSFFVIIVRALSLTSIAFNCSSVCFYSVCHLNHFTFIEDVSSSNLTVTYSFNCLCFVKWDS